MMFGCYFSQPLVSVARLHLRARNGYQQSLWAMDMAGCILVTVPISCPLAFLSLRTMSAPKWFVQALAEKPETGILEVDGKRLSFSHWPGSPSPRAHVVLVHGTGAHRRWWDFIAPQLTGCYSVAAPDLSGMGDSDHSETYRMEDYAAELAALVAHLQKSVALPVYLVGHSMGGFIAMHCSRLGCPQLAGLVIMDSPVRPPGFDDGRHIPSNPIRKRKLYLDAESILTRFRLMPEQSCKNGFILDYIARHSIREEGGGYRWKFDETVLLRLGANASRPPNIMLGHRVPLTFLYGEQSKLMMSDVLSHMREQVGREQDILMRAIPNAGHHLFLDQPLAVVEAMLEAFAAWE